MDKQQERTPDQTVQIGNATCHIFAPQNLTPEERERREVNLHKAIARILNKSNTVLEGA